MIDNRVFILLAFLLCCIAGGLGGNIIFYLLGGHSVLSWIGGVAGAFLSGYGVACLLEQKGWIEF